MPQTEIKGNLVVGDFVKVHAWQQQDGSLIAREIEKEKMSSETELEDDQDHVKGIITAINGDSITVAGVLVLINSFTEIKDNFKIGDFVEVEGLLQSDGSILAREIGSDDDMNDDSDDDMDDDSDDDMDDESDDDMDDGSDDDDRWFQ